MTKTTEVITIEAVGKFGPKTNKGWMGVKKPLAYSDFQKGLTYEVVTEPWNSKGKSGINIVEIVKTTEPVEITKYAESGTNANGTVTTTSVSSPAVIGTVKASYNSSNTKEKDRRILVQGLVQATLASPSLAGLPFTTPDDIIRNVKRVATEMIEFVESGN